jgi:hypothetical protein
MYWFMSSKSCMNPVLACALQVSKESRSVRVNDRGISRYAGKLIARNRRHWLDAGPFFPRKLEGKDRLAFAFLLNAISYSYWGEPKWTVEYNGKHYDGAQGMVACLGRAAENGKPIFKAEYLAEITSKELGNILRGNTTIPLLEERKKSLNELGKAVCGHGGNFGKVFALANGQALKLVDVVLTLFPSFEDKAVYLGKTIHFNKRVQLLVSDVCHMIGGMQGAGKLTACADYKLPQVLRRHGILEYADGLRERVLAKAEIPAGSEEETEIRANTIVAIEMIKGHVRLKVPGITSMQINDMIWLEGQVKLPGDEPYHRTRTTAY